MDEIYFPENNINDMFEEFPIVKGDRVLLRNIENLDWKDIINIYDNRELLIVDRVPEIYGKNSSKNFIKYIHEKYKSKERVDWAIEEIESKKVIGLVGIYNISVVDSKVEIGYVLNKNYMRQGIMTEVMLKIIDFLINGLDVNRIEANVYRENMASIRLCEKVGFKKEGLRLSYMYNGFTGIYMDSYIFAIIKGNI